MSSTVSISDVAKKRVLLHDRLNGEQGLALAIAMVLDGIWLMVQLRQSPETIRRMADVAVVEAEARKGTIRMPSGDEIAKVLGMESGGDE